MVWCFENMATRRDMVGASGHLLFWVMMMICMLMRADFAAGMPLRTVVPLHAALVWLWLSETPAQAARRPSILALLACVYGWGLACGWFLGQTCAEFAAGVGFYCWLTESFRPLDTLDLWCSRQCKTHRAMQILKVLLLEVDKTPFKLQGRANKALERLRIEHPQTRCLLGEPTAPLGTTNVKGRVFRRRRSIDSSLEGPGSGTLHHRPRGEDSPPPLEP